MVAGRTKAREWLRLVHTPGLGAVAVATLVERFGSPAAVLAAADGELRSAGLSPVAITGLRGEEPAGVAADLAWAGLPDRHLVTIDDPRYPPLLRELSDRPPVLYVTGDPDALARPQLAIVGSRNPTPQGAANAREFAAGFAAAGIVVTSGLALGIDAAAHGGALAAGGATIAVMGTGPDRIYPARNRDLARSIAATGALVTEFPVGAGPHAGHFPRRNRIISGLVFGVLVVEAAEASGSLITARLAAEQGREVFAIPGSIHNPLARGCHRLIRQGAKLVETERDIIEELGWIAPHPPVVGDGEEKDKSGFCDDPDYARLHEALGFDPVSIDEIVARSGLTVAAVSSMLLVMELRGQVALQRGGRYQRIDKREE